MFKKTQNKTSDIYDVSLIMLRKVLVSKNYLKGPIKKTHKIWKLWQPEKYNIKY